MAKQLKLNKEVFKNQVIGDAIALFGGIAVYGVFVNVWNFLV